MNQCDHPSHGNPSQATHGLPGEDLTSCANHAEPGMVLLTAAFCDSITHGNTRAKAWYGNPGEPPTKCRTHATETMENKLFKRCTHQDCTEILPIFGYGPPVDPNPTHGFPGFVETVTAENATEFMIDFSQLTCQRINENGDQCTEPATVGHSYEPALYCDAHAGPNMRKTRYYRTAIIGPTADRGFPGESAAYRCILHAEPGMVRL